MWADLERLERACAMLDEELRTVGRTPSPLVYHRVCEVAFAGLEVAAQLDSPPVDAIATLSALVNVHVLGFLRSPPLRPCLDGQRAGRIVLERARSGRFPRTGTDG